VLGVKLPHLEGWTEDRRRNAARLDQLLSEVAEVQTPYVSPLVRHVYHLYTIRAEQRDALCEHLNANGVGARKHNTTPLHRQKAYIALGHGSEDLPVTTQLANQVLSLPVYPELTEPQIDIIADQVRGFYA
jgi:dTDP-4-amino-4,6-dideoxygalactose transaminase